jgi:hypothetical protein
MDNRTKRVRPIAGSKGVDKISLKGLDFKDAVSAAMQTGKAPPIPKKAKRKAKK